MPSPDTPTAQAALQIPESFQWQQEGPKVKARRSRHYCADLTTTACYASAVSHESAYSATTGIGPMLVKTAWQPQTTSKFRCQVLRRRAAHAGPGQIPEKF